jgi:hypothetical protein
MIQGGPSPSQADINTVLRSFLTGVLPEGMPVVLGQVNRVPEPLEGNYAVFWPMTRDRISWNIDTYADMAFTASISGATMTVTAVPAAGPKILGGGIYVFGVDVLAKTRVVAQTGGDPGGVGTYTVDKTQSVVQQGMAAGKVSLTQPTRLTVQVDVHGDAASDNAQIISTAFQDQVAQDYFDPATTNVAPLYCDSPRQMPFINGENQYEDRYIVDLHLSVDQTVVFSQQFADTLNATPVPADATRQPIQ